MQLRLSGEETASQITNMIRKEQIRLWAREIHEKELRIVGKGYLKRADCIEHLRQAVGYWETGTNYAEEA